MFSHIGFALAVSVGLAWYLTDYLGKEAIVVVTKIKLPWIRATPDDWHRWHCPTSSEEHQHLYKKIDAPRYDTVPHVVSVLEKTLDTIIDILEKSDDFKGVDEPYMVEWTCCTTLQEDLAGWVVAESVDSLICLEVKPDEIPRLAWVTKRHCITPPQTVVYANHWMASRANATWPHHWHTWLIHPPGLKGALRPGSVGVWHPSERPRRADKTAGQKLKLDIWSWFSALPYYSHPAHIIPDGKPPVMEPPYDRDAHWEWKPLIPQECNRQHLDAHRCGPQTDISALMAQVPSETPKGDEDLGDLFDPPCEREHLDGRTVCIHSPSDLIINHVCPPCQLKHREPEHAWVSRDLTPALVPWFGDVTLDAAEPVDLGPDQQMVVGPSPLSTFARAVPVSTKPNSLYVKAELVNEDIAKALEPWLSRPWRGDPDYRLVVHNPTFAAHLWILKWIPKLKFRRVSVDSLDVYYALTATPI